MNNEMSSARPNFEYPCAWGYSLIAGQESHIHLAIRQTFGQHPVQIGELRKSSGGRWCAVNVDTTVTDEHCVNASAFVTCFKMYKGVSSARAFNFLKAQRPQTFELGDIEPDLVMPQIHQPIHERE